MNSYPKGSEDTLKLKSNINGTEEIQNEEEMEHKKSHKSLFKKGFLISILTCILLLITTIVFAKLFFTKPLKGLKQIFNSF